jgi:carboxypeptidase Q
MSNSLRKLMSLSATLVGASLLMGLAFDASCTARAADVVPDEPSKRTEALRKDGVDLATYAAVRGEGLGHSEVMTFVSALSDGIGARLMGSPNMQKAYDWSLATLTRLGAHGAHLEDFGEFGLSWRQNNAWMRMSAPDSMVFVAQAGPWSVSTHGSVEGDVVPVEINNEADFAKYRGHLKRKVVFLGPLRPVPTPIEPFAVRYTDAALESGEVSEPVRKYYQTIQPHIRERSETDRFRLSRNAFLQREGVLAIVFPSADGERGGGTGDLAIDNGALAGRPWVAEERPAFPVIFTAIEDFGRVWRMTQAGTPVRVQFNVDTQDLAKHEHAFNVVADIPGSDPALHSQIVLVGGHLDSWASGEGATDDGAGVAAALEVARILQALHIQPRRTIRIILFGGEEEGLLGSEGYAKSHLGSVPRSTEPDQLLLTRESWRRPIGPVKVLPEYDLLSAAYNVDHGGGRIRAVYTAGNPKLAAVYRRWIAPLKDLGVAAVFDEPSWPADQSTFTNLGIPGILFLQDPLDYSSRSHHTNMDTMERIVATDLAQVATVLTIFAIDSANRDELLPRTKDAEVSR